MVIATSGRDLINELSQCFSLVETGAECPGDADRRRSVRYELQSGSVPVDVSSRYGLSARGLLADVSSTGARIITDYVPCPGETVRLAFEVGCQQVVLDGEVRHVGVERAVRYFGVSFTE